MKDISIYILARNAYNIVILDKLQDILKINPSSYIITDVLPENISENILSMIEKYNLKQNIIYYDDNFMINCGWKKSSIKKSVTSWDKALYHAYSQKKEFNWFIEDDVYWSDKNILKKLFTINDESELITNHCIEDFKTNYYWFLFFETNKLIDDSSKWKATFNPICRLSYKILEKMNEYSCNFGTLLFHEIIFATICNIYNYNVLYYRDMNLPFRVQLEWRENSIDDEEINQLKKENIDLLLHPVKIPNI